MTVTELKKRFKVLELEGYGDQEVRVGPDLYWGENETSFPGHAINLVCPIGGEVRIVPSED